MFKVDNKDTRMTSLTLFLTFSGACIVDFEQVNVCWVVVVQREAILFITYF